MITFTAISNTEAAARWGWNPGCSSTVLESSNGFRVVGSYSCGAFVGYRITRQAAGTEAAPPVCCGNAVARSMEMLVKYLGQFDSFDAAAAEAPAYWAWLEAQA